MSGQKPVIFALWILAAAALLPSGRASIDPAQSIESGLEAERQRDPWTALDHFRRADQARPNDPMIQQKIAQQLSDAAFLEDDTNERIRLAREALPYAQRAAELDPQSPVALLSLSVLYGRLAVEGSIPSRLDNARRIKLHAEQALEIDPKYAWAWHVLGRWHVELSQIGFAKRAIGTLFGGIPEASLHKGIQYLETAVEIEPAAVPHRVELGFSYQVAGRIEAARSSWQGALELPSVEIYDDTAKRLAREALDSIRIR